MPLPTVAKLAYVASILAVSAAGTVNMLAHRIEDVPLGGVEEPLPAPRLDVKSVWTEAFQHDAFAWFQQHWGLRGYAVRTDNTIGARVFHEARTDQHAVVGDDGVLFTRDDINYTNRDDAPDEMIALARRFARVQRAMRERGKVFLPMIMPSKTSVYPDAVPRTWRRSGTYRRSDENVYGAFVRTLAEEGARFADARALLAPAAARRPSDVFEPTGRHWRASVGCKALAAALDAARPELPELGAATIDCRTTLDPSPSVDEEDFDIYRLLNVWGPKPTGIDVDRFAGEKGSPELQIPTLFVGSSFVWKFAHASRELEVLQPSTVYFYDVTAVDVKSNAMKPVEPFTDEWRRETFEKRFFLVAVLETFLPEDGRKFVGELEKELGLPSPQNLK